MRGWNGYRGAERVADLSLTWVHRLLSFQLTMIWSLTRRNNKVVYRVGVDTCQCFSVIGLVCFHGVIAKRIEKQIFMRIRIATGPISLKTRVLF
jgi:hypothetical protein